MPLDNEIYFCIKYYLYIIYLLYGWGKLVSSIQVQQGAKITPVPFEAGETLLSALRRAGYSIPAACGGKGRCGKCRVKVNGVPRLACKTRAQDGDWIDLPETMRGVILTDTLTLPKAQAGRSGLGAAVDLGTTTVALRLFDRADGKLLAQAQDWNAQAPYGADVISRIQHTMEASDGLGELSRCIRAQTETLLGQTLSAAGRRFRAFPCNLPRASRAMSAAISRRDCWQTAFLCSRNCGCFSISARTARWRWEMRVARSAARSPLAQRLRARASAAACRASRAR